MFIITALDHKLSTVYCLLLFTVCCHCLMFTAHCSLTGQWVNESQWHNSIQWQWLGRYSVPCATFNIMEPMEHDAGGTVRVIVWSSAAVAAVVCSRQYAWGVVAVAVWCCQRSQTCPNTPGRDLLLRPLRNAWTDIHGLPLLAVPNKDDSESEVEPEPVGSARSASSLEAGSSSATSVSDSDLDSAASSSDTSATLTLWDLHKQGFVWLVCNRVRDWVTPLHSLESGVLGPLESLDLQALPAIPSLDRRHIYRPLPLLSTDVTPLLVHSTHFLSNPEVRRGDDSTWFAESPALALLLRLRLTKSDFYYLMSVINECSNVADWL